jgi:predicted HTH transcriptional regulator
MLRSDFHNYQIFIGLNLSKKKFERSSEVKCASFHGTIVEKPIPSYKVFKGTVFELVDQAVDFVLAKLDYTVGTRANEVQAPGGYEIPKEVISEAIVNAVAHRDYTGNGSVQVMLFPTGWKYGTQAAFPSAGLPKN